MILHHPSAQFTPAGCRVREASRTRVGMIMLASVAALLTLLNALAGAA